MGAALVFAGLLATQGLQAKANSDSEIGVPVQTVVTVQAHHGSSVPMLQKEDVVVKQEGRTAPVLSWIPAQGQRAGMELLVLLDDSSGLSLGSEIGELKEFIMAQPPTTMVGVGYMYNGTVEMVQNFTSDHNAAANSLRLPVGSAVGSASPYFSLLELTKRWGKNPNYPRREIVMMSDGEDPYAGGEPVDPYVDQASAALQSAGIPVFTIQTPGGGRFGRTFGAQYWGGSYLITLAERTGGVPLYTGYGPAVSFAPFLDEMNRLMSQQYLLVFEARNGHKAEMQKIKVTTEVPNAKLINADEVYVPGVED
jgi:hypothetical protein